jgi:hypothetical protein
MSAWVGGRDKPYFKIALTTMDFQVYIEIYKLSYLILIS